jgi:hypothetical protein
MGLINVVYQLTGVSPLDRVGERLGKDICRLVGRNFIQKLELFGSQHLVQPRHTHLVCAFDVPHRRVAASLADLDHSLIVLMESDPLGRAQQKVPERQGRYAFQPHCSISRNSWLQSGW